MLIFASQQFSGKIGLPNSGNPSRIAVVLQCLANTNTKRIVASPNLAHCEPSNIFNRTAYFSMASTNNPSKEDISRLVFNALGSAWNNRDNLDENSKRSSFFVSELAKGFADEYQSTALVQTTDTTGKKSPGEWLLDIAIVTFTEVRTDYKNRSGKIVEKINWAIESEFSTNIQHFCNDFAKLLHIKAEGYLYIAGLNQKTEKARIDYINAQHKLALSLVQSSEAKSPFFLMFIPTPGKGKNEKSLWNEYNDFNTLKNCCELFKLA